MSCLPWHLEPHDDVASLVWVYFICMNQICFHLSSKALTFGWIIEIDLGALLFHKTFFGKGGKIKNEKIALVVLLGHSHL